MNIEDATIAVEHEITLGDVASEVAKYDVDNIVEFVDFVVEEHFAEEHDDLVRSLAKHFSSKTRKLKKGAK